MQNKKLLRIVHRPTPAMRRKFSTTHICLAGDPENHQKKSKSENNFYIIDQDSSSTTTD